MTPTEGRQNRKTANRTTSEVATLVRVAATCSSPYVALLYYYDVFMLNDAGDTSSVDASNDACSRKFWGFSGYLLITYYKCTLLLSPELVLHVSEIIQQYYMTTF